MDDDMSKKDRQLMERMEKFMNEKWGKRCPKYCIGCGVCEAWASFYTIFNLSDAEELAWEHHQNSRKKRLNEANL